MEENKVQTIYINMDDSGRLIKGEPDELVFVYGGVFFLSLNQQENFSRQYKALVDLIKPKYCKDYQKDDTLDNSFCITHNYQNCKYNCPELKSNMLRPQHRRRLLNFIKKYDTSVAVVSNYRVNDYIFDSKASKGRFKDYIIKREVKRIVENLIVNAVRYSDRYIEVSINKQGIFTIKNSTQLLDDVDIHLLFNKFYTADKSRTKGSSGLGLYIVKELLKKIDGKIESVDYDKQMLSISIRFSLFK